MPRSCMVSSPARSWKFLQVQFMQKHVQRRYFTCQFITSNLEFFLMSMEGKEYHQKQLVKHCRVCGKAVKGYAHSVKKEHRNSLAVVGIDTSKDSKEEHPNTFCNSCYLTVRQVQAADLSGNVRKMALCPFQWVPHQEGCTVCSHFASSESGGRPRKHKNPCGRQKMESGHYISIYSPSALPATWSTPSWTSPDFHSRHLFPSQIPMQAMSAHCWPANWNNISPPSHVCHLCEGLHR